MSNQGETGAIVLLWRWNTGAPMDGIIRTDAGWFTRGKHAYHRTGKVYSWHYLPRIKRAGVRWAINLWVVGTLGVATQNVVGGLAFGGFFGLAGIIVLTVIAVRKARAAWENTHTVTPIAEGLAERVGISPQDSEGRLKLSPGYREIKVGKVGSYRIPGSFGGSKGEQVAVETVIRSRLPNPVEFAWHLSAGKGGYVSFSAVPPLPTMARLLDYKPQIEALGPQKYLAGVTTGGTYTARFKGPEPHHGYCWGTSVGKSSQLASILAQAKHNEPGLTASIIDPKDISLAFLHGIPGFEFFENSPQFDEKVNLTEDNYLTVMPDMWKGIYGTYRLMRNRFAEMEKDRTREFNTHLLVLEEHNSMFLMSKTWWQRNKPKGSPVIPPIGGDWIAPLFWRARQANIFIILAAQSIQERFLWNLNLRPSLGLLSLAKFKPSHYESYIGTTPVPKSQKGQGRALFNDGEVDTWVQCLYAEEQEYRSFALENVHQWDSERSRVNG